MNKYLKRMMYFSNLTLAEKEKIFISATKNDFRYRNTNYEINNIIVNNLKELNIKVELNKNNIIKSIIMAKKEIKSVIEDEVKQSIILNNWLYLNNLCPLINFAFDKWYYNICDNEQSIFEQIDLSVTYLYRLVKQEKENNIEIINRGAYSEIYINGTEQTISKIPSNLSARLFANEEEYKNNMNLINTDLKKYIPALIRYNKDNKEIVRQYIKGYNGHEILKLELLTEKKINELEKIFQIIRRVTKQNNVRLDIHPANFVWSDNEQSWYLVDLGIVPKIGYDYYPEDFKEYLTKIWLERLYRMKKYPIRSVEI